MLCSPLTHSAHAKSGSSNAETQHCWITAGIGYPWSSMLTVCCGGFSTSEWINSHSTELGCVYVFKAQVSNCSGINTSFPPKGTHAVQPVVLLPSRFF